MTTLVEFEVIGVPMPQGSKKAFIANGRAMMKESSGGHAAWRNAVSDKAREAAAELTFRTDWYAPLDGALGLSIEFRFPMPKSRPKAARARGWCHKTTAPDTDKLVRTIGDALQSAGLVADDARFCNVHATKTEVTGWVGAAIRIIREDEP